MLINQVSSTPRSSIRRNCDIKTTNPTFSACIWSHGWGGAIRYLRKKRTNQRQKWAQKTEPKTGRCSEGDRTVKMWKEAAALLSKTSSIPTDETICGEKCKRAIALRLIHCSTS